MIDADKNREERPPEPMSRFKVAFTDNGYLPNKSAPSLTSKKSAPVIKNQRSLRTIPPAAPGMAVSKKHHRTTTLYIHLRPKATTTHENRGVNCRAIPQG